MVAPIYSNKKGIYKDLYSQIDSDNKKKKAEVSAKRTPKGIYRDLYQHILGFEGQETSKNGNWKINIIQPVQKTISLLFSRTTYFFSTTSSSLKILILACLIVKKPVNNYIKNSFPSNLRGEGDFQYEQSSASIRKSDEGAYNNSMLFSPSPHFSNARTSH